MRRLARKIVKSLMIQYPSLASIAVDIAGHLKGPICVKRGGQRKALLCYITKPFRSHSAVSHPNHTEALIIAGLLAELNYEVDVVDHNSQFAIDYRGYDVLIGFGRTFARSFCDTGFNGRRILYLTGANPHFSNIAEAERIKRLYERRGVRMEPRREVYWPWVCAAVNSDALIVLGNEWTLTTYASTHGSTFLVPVPYVQPVKVEKTKSDFIMGGRRFLWFGGGGAVHKGLDVLLEAVDNMRDDVHLDVCGPVDLESDFIALYRTMLWEHPKISFHGFVEAESAKMREILARNAFVIFPSCSEGGGSSVLTCMSAGLIPVVTEEASVETGDFGISIASGSITSIQDAIRQAISLSEAERTVRSRKAAEYAVRAHSREAYSTSMREALIRCL